MLNNRDKAITIKTIETNAEGLGAAIKQYGLTVDRLVALAYDPNPGNFQITYVDAAIKVRDKMTFGIMRNNLPSVLSWNKVKGVRFFETINMNEATLKRIAAALKQLDDVRDTKGNAVDEIYFVGANANIAHQHVLMPDGNVVTTDRIAHVRYNRETDTLFGVARDGSVLGIGIFAAKGTIAERYDMFMVENWQQVYDARFESPIVNISRIMAKDGEIAFTANFLGGTCRTAKLFVTADGIKAIWTGEYKSPYIVLGTLFGHNDVFVRYDFDDQSVIVALDKTKKQRPFAV